MRAFFDSLNPRERLLIGVAAVLLAILVLILVIIRPLASFRNDARAEFDGAASTYVLVNRAAARPRSGEAVDPSALRSILTRTAGRSGIVINRINSENARIDMSIGDTATASLYSWISMLERDHQILVLDASIRPNADGRTVTARLTVTKGAS